MINNLIIIKQIINEKILDNKFEYNLLYYISFNSIKNNIKIMIDDYYLLDILEFENLKNKILMDLNLFIKKNNINQEKLYFCNNIIDLIKKVYFPSHLNKYTIKNKIKFIYKQNSQDINNCFLLKNKEKNKKLKYTNFTNDKKNTTNSKSNDKIIEYNIISKKLLFDWNKSFISI